MPERASAAAAGCYERVTICGAASARFQWVVSCAMCTFANALFAVEQEIPSLERHSTHLVDGLALWPAPHECGNRRH
jgi:hypothetical protein